METKSLNEKHACPMSDRAERGGVNVKAGKNREKGVAQEEISKWEEKRRSVSEKGTHPPTFVLIFFHPKFPLFCISDVNNTLACKYIMNFISF